jgi:hypothetical protein
LGFGSSNTYSGRLKSQNSKIKNRKMTEKVLESPYNGNGAKEDQKMTKTTGQKIGRNIAFGIAGLAGVSVLAAAPFVLQYAKSSLPYMATPRRKVVDALAAIKKNISAKDEIMIAKQNLSSKTSTTPTTTKTLRFTDLGSGDGEAVLAAAQHGWLATGVEMNPTLWFISFFRKMLLSRSERQRAHFIVGDLFQQNISNSNAIMIFGINPLMPRIDAKLGSEARVGAFVIAYRFELPLKSIRAKVIYNEEDMRVYEILEKLSCKKEQTS